MMFLEVVKASPTGPPLRPPASPPFKALVLPAKSTWLACGVPPLPLNRCSRSMSLWPITMISLGIFTSAVPPLSRLPYRPPDELCIRAYCAEGACWRLRRLNRNSNTTAAMIDPANTTPRTDPAIIHWVLMVPSVDCKSVPDEEGVGENVRSRLVGEECPVADTDGPFLN